MLTLSLKSISAFLCLKYTVFSFVAGKTCFGLFAVKLGCFQRYCTEKMLSASLQRVNNVSVYFWVGYTVYSMVFGGTAFSFFRTQTALLTLWYPPLSPPIEIAPSSSPPHFSSSTPSSRIRPLIE